MSKNYFELLGLPIALQPDVAAVRQHYLALSRENHPDYFANGSLEAQAAALDTSAALNKALKTLTDRDETIRYVLSLKGLLEAEEKYTLPPSFLGEMMEINEALAEGDASQVENIRDQLAELETQIYAPVRQTVENYEDGKTGDAELLAVKEYYFKKKYLRRLSGQLAGMS